MRPRKEQTKHHKGKKLNKFQKSRNHFCYLRRVNHKEGSNIEETFNNIIREHKSQSKDVKTWKVAPKDSCEVYKDRRKRKIEDNAKTDEKVDSEKPESNKKSIKKRKRRPLKRDSRGRFLPNTSSTHCSCSKCADSIFSDDDK